MALARTLPSILLSSTLCAGLGGVTNDTKDLIVAWSLDGSIIYTDGHHHDHSLRYNMTAGPAARNGTTGEKVWQGPKVPDDIISVAAGPLSYSAGRLISTCWRKGSEPPEPQMGFQGSVSFCHFSADNGDLLKVVNTSKKYLTSDPYRASKCGSVDGKYLADFDFSPHDTYKITPPYELVRIWDANTGDMVMSLDHSNGWFQDADNLRSLAFSPDGKHMATVGGDGTSHRLWDGMVSVWNLDTRKRMKLSDQGGPMTEQLSVSFSPDGKHFATVGEDCPQEECPADSCTIRVWDVASGSLRKIETGFNKSCGDKVLWSPDGAKIATLSLYSGHWHIWDAVTGQCYMDITIRADTNQDSITLGLWSPDGSHFAWQQWFNVPWVPDINAPVHIVPFSHAGCPASAPPTPCPGKPVIVV